MIWFNHKKERPIWSLPSSRRVLKRKASHARRLKAEKSEHGVNCGYHFVTSSNNASAVVATVTYVYTAGKVLFGHRNLNL